MICCPMIRCGFRAPAMAAHRMSSGRAPGFPCASTATTRQSISPSSAPGQAAAPWPASWRKPGSRSWRWTPGAYWRPLEDFASDETEQNKLFWNDERICDGDDPLQMGSNNSGKSVGGSTVHFAMVSLRFRPEWFKSRSLLGYGADWPLDWREMWRYYGEVEQALKIAGPVRYPWGPNARATPTARTRSTRPVWCWRRGRKPWVSPGRRLRWRPFQRPVAWRTPAFIAASACWAARPTPSRACC